MLFHQDHLKEPRVARMFLIAHIESNLIVHSLIPMYVNFEWDQVLICKIVNHIIEGWGGEGIMNMHKAWALLGYSFELVNEIHAHVVLLFLL